MTYLDEVLLKVLSEVLQGQTIDWDPVLTAGQWESVITLANEHGVLPLVCDAVYHLKSFQELDKTVRDSYQERAVRQTIRQIDQEKDFLTLLLFAQEHGYDPIVLKGMIVRHLYPQPYLRPSVDEDILVAPQQAEAVHQLLLDYGFTADSPETNVSEKGELSYHKPNSPSYIELHKYPFGAGSDTFGEFNDFFSNQEDRTIHVQIEDVTVSTLEPGCHLLYLILHMFKHFAYSGVGIRPICDIGLFAEEHVNEIDWSWLRGVLEQAGVFFYVRALFRIIQLFLLPDSQVFDRISDWKIEKVKVRSLLDDMFASGLHGASSATRLHSSNMTLIAVEAKKKGRKKYGRGVLRTVFPPLKSMCGRYPYLNKAPLLLPVAWLQRIAHYLKETRSTKGGMVSESAASIRLGQERVELLKKYHII